MMPHYKNFTGEITRGASGFECWGWFEVELHKNQINITELPISTWTSNYKKFLEDEITTKDK